MTRTSWRRTTMRGILIAAAALIAGGAWSLSARRATEARLAAAATMAVEAAAAESEVRTKDIAFYETRAASDPESAGDRAQIAALYFQRARETSDVEDYVRAEEAARASLARRKQHNDAAFAVLTSALLAQHRLSDARDVARQLVDVEPHVDGYRAMLGETCLELGDYSCARAAFQGIYGQPRGALAVAPRLARWAEIQRRYREGAHPSADGAVAGRLFARPPARATRVVSPAIGRPRSSAGTARARRSRVSRRPRRAA